MSDFSTARQKMVDGQVRPSDVTDLRIIDAMLAVPREDFVPVSQRAMAYLDIDLDISAPGASKRFLIKPVVLARMLQAAEVAKIAGKVTATEGDPALVAKAADCLARLGSSNTVFKAAMAADGYAGNGPYDVIVLVGATEVVPNDLYRQLAPGGRLVGVFAMTQPQRAMIVTHSHDDFGTRALFDAAVPVLPGLERLPAFVF
jgi:protein-L-isoaspartate(D-aspartate) O-methyltransferase